MSRTEAISAMSRIPDDTEELKKHSDSTLMYLARFVPRAFMRALQRLQRQAFNTFLDNPLFGPVSKEVFTEELEVEGQVPEDLEGVFIRTGSNPQHRPWGGYHWFDGEAMVHAVYFDGGKAKSYHNHWLRTFRYYTEKAAGCNVYGRFGDFKGLLGLVIMMLTKLLSPLLYAMPALGRLAAGQLGNTALVFHGGRLLGLMEGGLPFLLRLCSGAVRSLGAYNFGGQLAREMTAHPKLDPHTGELLAFAYQVQPTQDSPDLVTFYTVSPLGAVSAGYPVDVAKPQMMHDFAISERYAVFMDHALVFDGAAMVSKGTLPFVMDTSRPSRIGLVRRDAPDQGARWFEVPPFVCFHTATAWDDGDTVNLVLCKYDNLDLGLPEGEEQVAFPTRFTLDTLTGEVSETCLSDEFSVEFPVVPPASMGRFTRYSYMAGDRPLAKGAKKPVVARMMQSLAKIDMTAGDKAGLVAALDHEGSLVGMEFVFVPRVHSIDVDDGYLVGYATDAETETSYCLVYDAKTMSSTPVAKVSLPQRVPAGFHGLWVTKQQLTTQEPAPGVASA